jgi:hypothetical protein
MFVASLFLAIEGCSNSSAELPTVPPPPPEGTVSATPPSAGVLPKEAVRKLRGKARNVNDGVPAN